MNPESVFRALVEEGVEFVLVGGLAATAHGASLVTFDIDLCFRRTGDNCERLARALGRLEVEVFPPRQIPIPITPELLQSHRLLHLSGPAGRLDLLAEIPGLGSYDDLFPGATRIDLHGATVPVLSLDQLIQAKSALQQSKDRQHLDQLLQVRRLREDQGES
jgi:predicted nucleotidyltransferase